MELQDKEKMRIMLRNRYNANDIGDKIVIWEDGLWNVAKGKENTPDIFVVCVRTIADLFNEISTYRDHGLTADQAIVLIIDELEKILQEAIKPYEDDPALHEEGRRENRGIIRRHALKKDTKFTIKKQEKLQALLYNRYELIGGGDDTLVFLPDGSWDVIYHKFAPSASQKAYPQKIRDLIDKITAYKAEKEIGTEQAIALVLTDIQGDAEKALVGVSYDGNKHELC